MKQLQSSNGQTKTTPTLLAFVLCFRVWPSNGSAVVFIENKSFDYHFLPSAMGPQLIASPWGRLMRNEVCKCIKSTSTVWTYNMHQLINTKAYESCETQYLSSGVLLLACSHRPQRPWPEEAWHRYVQPRPAPKGERSTAFLDVSPLDPPSATCPIWPCLHRPQYLPESATPC